jgi:hypothetical protein
MKRFLVVALAKVDEALDAVLYRPAVVKATMWMPRWYSCEIARLSELLDERWQVGWWNDSGPEGLCEICGRRAAWLEYQGGETASGFISPTIVTCSWCTLSGPTLTEDEWGEAIGATRRASISWRWR